MANQKVRSAAVVTIFDAGNMTSKARYEISAWLCGQAEFLTKHASLMSKRFTARYGYVPNIRKRRR